VAFFVIFFWAAFEQSASSMAFFANERTDRSLPSWLGWLVAKPKEGPPMWPAEWIQSINPFFILLLAPGVAALWTALAKRGKDIPTISKMATGLLLVAGGFVFMVIAASVSDGGTKVSPAWIAITLLVHTVAELCLSPVGLSLVSKLAPVRYLSGLMGAWYLANFFANFIAGRLAGLSEKIAAHGFILPGLGGFFLIFVIAPAIAGGILLGLSRGLSRKAHGLL
jgi:POT family proton-dependent oligopeptide transporter